MFLPIQITNGYWVNGASNIHDHIMISSKNKITKISYHWVQTYLPGIY